MFDDEDFDDTPTPEPLRLGMSGVMSPSEESKAESKPFKFPWLETGVVALAAAAILRETKPKEKAMPAHGEKDTEREVIYLTAMRTLDDPSKLRSLADKMASLGLTAPKHTGLDDWAEMLRRRAALKEQPESVKAQRREAFLRGMKSQNKDGVFKLAAMFRETGAFGAADTLEEHAKGLPDVPVSTSPPATHAGEAMAERGDFTSAGRRGDDFGAMHGNQQPPLAGSDLDEIEADGGGRYGSMLTDGGDAIGMSPFADGQTLPVLDDSMFAPSTFEGPPRRRARHGTPHAPTVSRPRPPIGRASVQPTSQGVAGAGGAAPGGASDPGGGGGGGSGGGDDDGDSVMVQPVSDEPGDGQFGFVPSFDPPRAAGRHLSGPRAAVISPHAPSAPGGHPAAPGSRPGAPGGHPAAPSHPSGPAAPRSPSAPGRPHLGAPPPPAHSPLPPSVGPRPAPPALSGYVPSGFRPSPPIPRPAPPSGVGGMYAGWGGFEGMGSNIRRRRFADDMFPELSIPASPSGGSYDPGSYSGTAPSAPTVNVTDAGSGASNGTGGASSGDTSGVAALAQQALDTAQGAVSAAQSAAQSASSAAMNVAQGPSMPDDVASADTTPDGDSSVSGEVHVDPMTGKPLGGGHAERGDYAIGGKPGVRAGMMRG
jgi:hypothetical protein